MSDILPTDAEFLDKIEQFIADNDLKPTAFGRMAVGDGNLIQGLKAHRSITLKTGRKILSFMSAYTAPAKQNAAA